MLSPFAPSSSHAPSSEGAAAGLPLTLLRIEGGLALAAAVLAYGALGGAWGLFALLFLLPDLSMAGYLLGRRLGALSYNAGHTYIAPALAGAVLYLADGPHVARLALIWAAHIGFDRLLGYGLKYPTGFGRTHLLTAAPRSSLAPGRLPLARVAKGA